MDSGSLMPAVSPWFFTHFGDEVSYSKNWVFPSDLLWHDRWRQILQFKQHFVEIISWNDYGESHYIGPLSSPHNDDGASKWVMDMYMLDSLIEMSFELILLTGRMTDG
jgi:hypothetical protein